MLVCICYTTSSYKTSPVCDSALQQVLLFHVVTMLAK